MNEKLGELQARVEQLEIHVDRLVTKACDLNSYFGNPLGVMNEETEIGPLPTDHDARGSFYGEDDEEEEPDVDERYARLSRRVENLEAQVQVLSEVFRDLRDNLGSPVG